MQNIFKRVAVLLAVTVCAMCLGLCLSACGGDEEANGYTVTVTYPDGKAVDGTKDGYNEYDEEVKYVEVQICIVKANGETGTCYDTKKLDANGQATLEKPPVTLNEGEKFKIQVNYAPEGYTYDYAYVTKPGSTTITLKKA